MPADLKRKSPPLTDDSEPTPSKRQAREADMEGGESKPAIIEHNESSTTGAAAVDDAAQRAKERQDRFKALKARQSQSRNQNRKETAAEAQRQQTDPNLLNSLNRKHAIASHKLMRADAEAAGEDFERKRAWDWTVEESERWDKRISKKEKHRDDVAFQDYRQDARKVYKRQMRDLKPDMEAYEKEKADAIKRAAESGGLEVIETDDGELVAVDKDGTFYSTANSTSFVENKPDKEKVDALVNDLKKAEEVRLRKRKERRGGAEDGDITYINEKNKVSSLCDDVRMQLLNPFSNSTRNCNASTTSTPQRFETTSREEQLCNVGLWPLRREVRLLSHFAARQPRTRVNIYIDNSKIGERLHSIPFLHAVLASDSISGTSTMPLTLSSSKASTAASATTSTFNGFVPPAPISHVSRPPVMELAMAPMAVMPARPIVIAREES